MLDVAGRLLGLCGQRAQLGRGRLEVWPVVDLGVRQGYALI